MAYVRELNCQKCKKPGVRVEVVGRFNSSEGLFCGPCGKRRLQVLQGIETENIALERTRPDLIGKLR